MKTVLRVLLALLVLAACIEIAGTVYDHFTIGRTPAPRATERRVASIGRPVASAESWATSSRRASDQAPTSASTPTAWATRRGFASAKPRLARK